jgi:hypothetical protein
MQHQHNPEIWPVSPDPPPFRSSGGVVWGRDYLICTFLPFIIEVHATVVRCSHTSRLVQILRETGAY